MKRIFLMSICVFLGACSGAAKDYYQNTKQDIQNHNYYHLVEAMELNQLFPSRAEKTEKELKNNCLENSERRVVTFSGSAEAYHYNECGHTPYPSNLQPQRF